MIFKKDKKAGNAKISGLPITWFLVVPNCTTKWHSSVPHWRKVWKSESIRIVAGKSFDYFLTSKIENKVGWNGAPTAVKILLWSSKLSYFQHSSQLEVKSSENGLDKLKICRPKGRAGSSQAFGTSVK